MTFKTTVVKQLPPLCWMIDEHHNVTIFVVAGSEQEMLMSFMHNVTEFFIAYTSGVQAQEVDRWYKIAGNSTDLSAIPDKDNPLLYAHMISNILVQHMAACSMIKVVKHT